MENSKDHKAADEPPLDCRVGRRIARYVLCPGYVRSRNDGQRHYVGPMDLARLYGVRIEQCEIYEPAQWWPESYYRMAEERIRGLIKLAPRWDGNYTVPNA